MELLGSLLGQYVVQSVLHSCIAAAVIEALIRLWRIRDSLLQSGFRLLELALPVAVMPLASLVYNPRTTATFREQVALFDSSLWLGLGVRGVYLWHVFLGVVLITALYFIVREALPAQFHSRHRRAAPGEVPRLEAALARLGQGHRLPAARVLVSPEAAPVIHTVGLSTLVISRSAVDLLDDDELEAVLAHELAHLTPAVYITAMLAAVLRVAAFFNPVALIVFHRIINDNERSCDAVAVSVTGKRLALASGLLKVYRRTASPVAGKAPLLKRARSLVERAHAVLISERVRHLAGPAPGMAVSYPGLRATVLAISLAVLLFFVV